MPQRICTPFCSNHWYSRSFGVSSIDVIWRTYEQDPINIFLWYNISDRLAEAATEKMHEYMSAKKQWGMQKHLCTSIPIFFEWKYQGIRPAVGYPSCPIIQTFILDEIFDMKQIGIRLTENGAMYPHALSMRIDVCTSGFSLFLGGEDAEDQLWTVPREEESVEMCA